MAYKTPMRILSFLFIVLFISTPAYAFQGTKAKQAYIVDYETGQVLLSKNAGEKMPTSSMSKVMTTYMVFDALKSGSINMDTPMSVSEKAWTKGGSKMFVGLGDKIKLSDLLRGVIVQSGNDATIVLAEGLSSSEEEFARKMTSRAHDLGMKNSNFTNASGWPDENHYSTAEDLALMSRHIIEDFPEYYKLFAETEFTYNNIKQQNRNPILYRNVGADGLKTGHTEAGGYGLIGTAVKDGRRVIMVVNGLEDDKQRADESVRLIEWSLNSFKNIDVFKKGDVIVDVPVVMGKSVTVPMAMNQDVKITVPKVPSDSYSFEVKYKTPLVAPVKAGDEVGTLKIIIPNEDNLNYPLIATQNVEKLGLFKNTLEKIKYQLLGKF